MTTYAYYPEMKESKPHHKFYDMEAQPSYDWKYFFVETPLELKGRGITFQRKLEAKNFMFPEKVAYKNGWNEYKVTRLAFSKLEEKYKIVREALLD